jgi:hypothetical protein
LALTNCAMMNISRADAMEMSLWEYESRLYHWNEAHGGDDVKAPDPEMTERMLALANSDPRFTN